MPRGTNEYGFAKEKIIKADSYIKVSDKFTPHYGITQLAEKFYARHDAVSHDLASNPIIKSYYDRISKRHETGPREMYETPISDSHNYGWLWDKASKYRGHSDTELFWKGKKVDAIMKIQNDVNLGVKRDRRYKMLR